MLTTLLCLFSFDAALAIDDDVPFFAGQTGLPNVMILFDNSDSMRASPYKTKSGDIYRPTSWQTAEVSYGITPTSDDDSSCDAGAPCIESDESGHNRFHDADGNLISTKLTLPGQNPPNLPGLYSNRSTVLSTTVPPAEPEYHGTDCVPGDTGRKCSTTIYDDSVDWSRLENGDADADALFVRAYKNWKVKITEKESGAVQYRTIIGRNSTEGCWEVQSGDSGPDDIEYRKGKVYTYELVVGLPGEVSRKSTDNTRVYDRNFNWNAVKAERDFDFMYNDNTLTITAGTNDGESRTIIGRNTLEGYWIVDAPFSDSCDISSSYKIDAAETFVNDLESKSASGGNHPESKMYQAKQALKQFLLSDKIKASYVNPNTHETSTRYLMNVGFATFMQAELPRTKAKYYRKIAEVPEVEGYTIPAHTIHHEAVHHDAEFKYKYRNHHDHNPDSYVPTGCVDGNPPAVIDPLESPGNWPQTYHNVANGGHIDRIWNNGNCKQQTIRYLVTYTCAPTDSLPGRVHVQLESRVAWENNPPAGHSSSELAGIDPDGHPQWGYTDYTWRTFYESDNTHTCETYSPPDLYQGWLYLVHDNESCHEDCETTAAYDEDAWDEEIDEVVVDPIPAKVAYYKVTWRSTWGDLRETNPDYQGYINRDPSREKGYIVTPSKGFNGKTWTRIQNPNPEPHDGGDGDFTLVTEDVQNGAEVCRGRKSDGSCSWTSKILAEEPVDLTHFRYPGRNDASNEGDQFKYPHGWSYKKTRLDPDRSTWYLYRLIDSGSYISPNQYFNNNDDHFVYVKHWTDGPSIWSNDIQKPVTAASPQPSYYPALTGNDFGNYQGEDQGVFVNLPRYDPASFNLGDDYEGSNVKRVLNRVNLALQRQYNNGSQLHTMAPGNPQSITVSTDSYETGNGTPLAATLKDAKKYFESYVRQDPLSLNGCRMNYVILLTDGTETTKITKYVLDENGNFELNEDGTKKTETKMADPAAAAAELWGLQVDGKPVPVRVFVVGFGLGEHEKIALNKIAAAGGPVDEDGHPATAYFANNVDDLVQILAEDIASVVTAGSYNRGKAGIVKGLSSTQTGLKVYNAYFDYPGWRGHLEANDVYLENEYDVNGRLLHRAGAIQGPSSLWATGCSGVYPTLVSSSSPDAGCIMAEDNQNPDSITARTIYTVVDHNGAPERVDLTPFSQGTIDWTTFPGNALKTALLPNTGMDIDGDGTSDTGDDAEAVIGYTLHPGYDQGKYKGTRTAAWPLADIYDSSPLVVSSPRDRGCLPEDADGDGIIDKSSPAEWHWANMTGYCQYNYLHQNRQGVVYFGTNGGMIEAINADDGTEKWGFIPDFVLSRLNEFRDGHRFTMDLNVVVADVDVSDGLAGTDWKTILVAGQRQGGEGYVALDVTDPDDPQYLWSFHDNNLGQSWSRPSVARIEISGVRTSVFIFGGGYSEDADKGNRIYIVKAADGSLLKEITVGGTSNNVPARIKTMRYLTDGIGRVIDYRTKERTDLPYGDDLGVDSDRRDFIEVAYFGDTEGNLWRLEGLNSDSGEPWDPQVVQLYQPDSDHDQPIYHVLHVVDRQGGASCNKRFVLAGTGDENNPTSLKDGSNRPLINYFFEVEDDGAETAVTDESNLQWRMSLGKQFPRNKFGFLLKPDGSGKYTVNGKYILSSYIFLLDISEYDPGNGPWAIDSWGNLTYQEPGTVNPVLAALKGEFLFKDSDKNLYSDYQGTNLVAAADDYMIVDISEWLTNHDGDFYDSSSDSGNIIIPAADVENYYYDNDGYWCDGNDPATCTRIKTDGNEVQIVPAMGEKMLAEPEGYGEQVYFMTYTPVGGCGTGKSFFYGVKASACGGHRGGTGLLTHGPGTETYPGTRKFFHSPQRKVGLGSGIANFTLGGGTAFIGQGGEVNALPIPVAQVHLKYWRQE